MEIDRRKSVMNIYYYRNSVFADLKKSGRFKKSINKKLERSLKNEIKRLIEFENRFGGGLPRASREVYYGIIEGKYRQDYVKKEIADYHKNGLPYLDI